MLLLIMHIPGQATRKELAEFVASARPRRLRWLPFVATPRVGKCEILRVEDRRRKTVEYHSLVSVQPLKSCQIVMDRLNGAKFFGRSVQVKPYFKRSSYKDRRRLHADLESLMRERRQLDRRRQSLSIRSRSCKDVRYT